MKKLCGRDGCTILSILKTIELYIHYKRMNFIVSELYLHKAITFGRKEGGGVGQGERERRRKKVEKEDGFIRLMDQGATVCLQSCLAPPLLRLWKQVE